MIHNALSATPVAYTYGVCVCVWWWGGTPSSVLHPLYSSGLRLLPPVLTGAIRTIARFFWTRKKQQQYKYTHTHSVTAKLRSTVELTIAVQPSVGRPPPALDDIVASLVGDHTRVVFRNRETSSRQS